MFLRLFSILALAFNVVSFAHTGELDSREANLSVYANALDDLFHLSSEKMQGRKNNTLGSQVAQQYLTDRYAQIGITAFDDYPDYKQKFSVKRAFTQLNGVNVIGYFPTQNGNHALSKYIVITAHYDHLGIEFGKMHYGADDNASGVAALLALAAFSSSLNLNSNVIFLATDAEEQGLHGARAALKDFPVDLSQIAFNLNLDMVAQVGKPAKIHMSGTRSAPQFANLLQDVRLSLQDSNVKLMGEHRRQRKRDSMLRSTNYRRASDHAVFIDNDIPFLYLGVTEHRYYHTEHDRYETINEEHFLQVIDIAKQVLNKADKAINQVEVPSKVPQPAASR